MVGTDNDLKSDAKCCTSYLVQNMARTSQERGIQLIVLSRVTRFSESILCCDTEQET